MHLTGCPRITVNDADVIHLSIEAIVKDLICDIARALVAGADDKAFNAVDDVGMTLDALASDGCELSEAALAERLHDQLDAVMAHLGLEATLTMGPRTAKAISQGLWAAAEHSIEEVPVAAAG